MFDCENCWYYDYDEEYDEYLCNQYLDEDEVARIIPILKSMGYEFVTLTDLFEVKNITPEARKDYYVVK